MTAASLQDDAATSHRDNAAAPKIVKGFVYFAAAAGRRLIRKMVIGWENIITKKHKRAGLLDRHEAQSDVSVAPGDLVVIGPIDHGRPPLRMCRANP